MTTYLTVLTVCLHSECVSLAIKSYQGCVESMRIAYAELYDPTIYISCDKTNILTATIRPQARPDQ